MVKGNVYFAILCFLLYNEGSTPQMSVKKNREWSVKNSRLGGVGCMSAPFREFSGMNCFLAKMWRRRRFLFFFVAEDKK